MAAVVPPIIPQVQEWVRQRPGALSLAQGMVFFRPPADVLEAGAGSTDDVGAYGPVFGDPGLREAFAERLRTLHGYADPDLERRLAVTAGANMGFLEVVLGATRPGDEVVLFEPFYFNHEMAVRIAGCKPVLLPSPEDPREIPEALAAATGPRTAAIVTVSPNNPTGVVHSQAYLAAVNAFAAAADLLHISDEAYDELTFEGAGHYAPAAAPEAAGHTVALYSMSKSYGLAGWRIGCAVLPERLCDDFGKVQDTNLICASRPAQRLAETLLRTWQAPRLELLAQVGRQRTRLLEALTAEAPGLRLTAGGGALYVWAELSPGTDSLAACHRLVEEFGVATVPGSAFASDGRGDRFVRISFGGITGTAFDEALDRLTRGLRSLENDRKRRTG